MTTPPPDPPLAGDELVAAGTEREVLEAFLDFHREVLIRKVSGVSEQDARYRRVPSRTTLAGLVQHMIGVERGWFQRVLAGRPAEEIGPNVGGGNDSWELGEDETVESLAGEYRRTCEQSRQTAARFALDDAVPQRRLGQVSLRWIYVHMIEETARTSGMQTSCASRPTVPPVWTANRSSSRNWRRRRGCDATGRSGRAPALPRAVPSFSVTLCGYARHHLTCATRRSARVLAWCRLGR